VETYLDGADLVGPFRFFEFGTIYGSIQNHDVA
jgi:hypothetical protein